MHIKVLIILNLREDITRPWNVALVDHLLGIHIEDAWRISDEQLSPTPEQTLLLVH